MEYLAHNFEKEGKIENFGKFVNNMLIHNDEIHRHFYAPPIAPDNQPNKTPKSKNIEDKEKENNKNENDRNNRAKNSQQTLSTRRRNAVSEPVRTGLERVVNNVSIASSNDKNNK